MQNGHDDRGALDASHPLLYLICSLIRPRHHELMVTSIHALKHIPSSQSAMPVAYHQRTSMPTRINSPGSELSSGN